MKIRIAYVETDTIYAKRFLNSFCTYYSDKVEIHTFSDSKSFLNLYDKANYDVVLLCDNIDSDILTYLSSELIINITSLPIYSSEGVPDIKKISKYQSMSTIYNEILSFLSEKFTILKSNQNNSSSVKIISFLSYDSSSGTSTLASSFTMNLSVQKKILYIDLQTYPTLYEFFSGEGNFSLSDIIYHIKSGKTNLLQRINSVVKEDKSGVFFIPPCTNSLEKSELTRENIAAIVDELKESNEYDLIVIDTDQIFTEIGKYILDVSDKLIFSRTDSSICQLKFQYMLNTLKLLQNKFETDYLSKAVIVNNIIRDKRNVEGQREYSPEYATEDGCIDEYKGVSYAGIIRLLQDNDIVRSLCSRCTS